ncbi:MAG TPA: biotin transporter BioY [Deltaproteobacteria bacterium]|nr:biotin transporter BioY [Deltaproteobacteria bacterium]
MTKKKGSIKGIVYAALFGALTAAGAFIIIPLPPVPITAQTFFLNVAAVLLGGPLGAASQFIYVMLGVVGIPVFAGGKAGLGVLFGPTGGYLIGFIFGAFVIGILVKAKKDPGVFWYIFSMIVGMLIIYTLGMIQLSFVAKLSLIKAATVGVLPFLPGDIIKIILAAIVSVKLKNRIKV